MILLRHEVPHYLIDVVLGNQLEVVDVDVELLAQELEVSEGQDVKKENWED